MMNFVFKREEVVSLISYTSFGADFDEKLKFNNFTTTEIYKTKTLGLDKLYDKGGFFNCKGNRGYVEFLSYDFFYIGNYLDDCNEEYKDEKEIKNYNQCFIYNLDKIYENTDDMGVSYDTSVLDYLECHGNRQGLENYNKNII